MYVNLDRTFHLLELTSNKSDAEAEYESSGSSPLDWDALLLNPRVILLAEAGSGKTEEIRQTAHRLRDGGQQAFFLRLEYVAKHFDESFEVGSVEEFNTWCESNLSGWIFLDSVDEARLQSPLDFKVAIRKIGNKLKRVLDQVCIVITSRPESWQVVADLNLCRDQLPLRELENQKLVTDPEDKEKSLTHPFTIVSLDDLNSQQVEKFARHHGVQNISDLSREIEKANASSFTSRPQDLIELIDFWLSNGRIGTHLELMENSIRIRIKEHDPDRALKNPLSEVRAMEGVKVLAAVLTLTQQQTVRVPGNISGIGVDCSDVFTDFNELERIALLSRPIFDEAIYGTVRFHHRSVREYLTARWFADLLLKASFKQSIYALFFKEQYGEKVVVPTLRPILPWLVLLDQKICQMVCEIAPEILFEGGDPSKLSLDVRQTLLRQVCERMVSEKTDSSATRDTVAIQRLAAPDLIEEVGLLLESYSESEEVTCLLLKMIWHGEMKGLLPFVRKFAYSTGTKRYTRISAFTVVNMLDSLEERLRLRDSFFNEATLLDRRLLAELVTELPADITSIEWLFACLKKVVPYKQFSSDYLPYSLSNLIQGCDDNLLSHFIELMANLISEPPFLKEEFCNVSQKHAYLLNCSAEALEILIKNRDSSALRESALYLLYAISTCERYVPDHHIYKNELSNLIPQWQELNLTFFWFRVKQSRERLERKGDGIEYFWQVDFGSQYFHFESFDFDAILPFITNQKLSDDRLVALSLAFNLYKQGGRTRKQLNQLKRAVKDDTRLEEELTLYLHPQTSPELRRIQKRNAEWKHQSQKRQQAEQKNRNKWISDLQKDPSILLTIENNKLRVTNSHIYLYRDLSLKEGDKFNRPQGQWQILEKEFGQGVAQAFRDSAVLYWRQHEPKLFSEGAPRNSIPEINIFGFVGITIESNETLNWNTKLTSSEAALAFRYAIYELNELPNWLCQIHEQHPKIITDMALTEVLYEISNTSDSGNPHGLLNVICHSGSWLWNDLAPHLLDYLRATEPTNLSQLRLLVDIIQGSSLTDEQLTVLAACKVQADHNDHTATWFALWVSVAPDVAIISFESYKEVIPDFEARSEFAMDFLTQLVWTRRSNRSLTRKNYQVPVHLEHLYLLMLRYINPKTDIQRSNQGVYSPGLRDDAQDARERLYTMIQEISGKTAYMSLSNIAKQHPNIETRPRYQLFARRKAEQDAALSPWTIQQVQEFQRTQENIPQNGRELFDVAVNRLLDLKADLEDGDNSIAVPLSRAKIETEMRNFFGDWLRARTLGRYTVTQEEELADAKRPDLRFHGGGFDNPVPVELKIAENWSGPSLLERLNNQLSRDYLRDAKSRYGLFLLVFTGQKHHWEINAQSFNFDELGSFLQHHADSFAETAEHMDKVKVICLDLTKRNKRLL